MSARVIQVEDFLDSRMKPHFQSALEGALPILNLASPTIPLDSYLWDRAVISQIASERPTNASVLVHFSLPQVASQPVGCHAKIEASVVEWGDVWRLGSTSIGMRVPTLRGRTAASGSAEVLFDFACRFTSPEVWLVPTWLTVLGEPGGRASSGEVTAPAEWSPDRWGSVGRDLEASIVRQYRPGTLASRAGWTGLHPSAQQDRRLPNLSVMRGGSLLVRGMLMATNVDPTSE